MSDKVTSMNNKVKEQYSLDMFLMVFVNEETGSVVAVPMPEFTLQTGETLESLGFEFIGKMRMRDYLDYAKQ